MYFGMKDHKIPIDQVPDCASWSFSITKAYSASVRAGTVLYKKEYTSYASAVATVVGSLSSLTYGSYSQWSWMGQMQLWDMIMSKPYTDPTSWIGAYSSIMDEKWDVLIDAFEGCPYIEITNPHAGAYAWFKMLSPYLGLQTPSSTPTFFLDVLGVQASTHSYVFRGANPADYYGAGYSIYDFVRMQLYRDINVYKEVARRAKIVCADSSATIGDFISVDQWYSITNASGNGHRSLHQDNGLPHTIETRRALLKEEHPFLTDAQALLLAKNTDRHLSLTEAIESSCAPEYTSSCMLDNWRQYGGDL